MERALLAVGTLLVLLIGVMAFSVYATREEEQLAVDNLLAESIGREVATSEANDRLVDMRQLTDFSWDRMLLVADDATREDINRTLGSEFTGQLNYDIESRELFLFMRDGELVRFADYRGRGSFEGVPEPVAALTPDEAVFEVRDLVARPVRPDAASAAGR